MRNILCQAESWIQILSVIWGKSPDDHWNYATKLTVANFDDEVKKNVDAGKTFFVRWIASAG